MKKILLILPLLLLTFSIVGCKDDDDNTIYPDAVIVEELPKLYVGNNQASIVIQSQAELEAVFSTEELLQVEDLQQIDFEKYTLLLGYTTTTTNAVTLEYFFSKTGGAIYTCLLKVMCGDAAVMDAFRYGILVKKLPTSAKVVFKIEEIHP